MNIPLYVGSSEYGTYRIVDLVYNSRPSRILYGADSSPQSGLALDDDPELLFDYNQRFMEIIMSQQLQSLLIIGGGTGTLATAAHNLFPNLVVDVIEIDELLVELGYKFFNLPQSSRIHPIIDDAYRYLKTSSERYDMIIIDAFSGYTIPPHLLQLETILLYRQHLADDGVVAINFISEFKKAKPSLAHEVVAAFSEVFPHTTVYQSDPDYIRGADQNYILTAGSSKLHFDFLQSKEVEPV